jgi:hypothetical protein
MFNVTEFVTNYEIINGITPTINISYAYGLKVLDGF